MSDIVLPTVEFGNPNGAPIIGLHGGYENAHHWEALAEVGLPHLRWVCPTLRGRGDTPPGTPPWTVAQNVRDVLATMDALGIERADVIGHSAGARDAIELAKVTSSRVRSAILLDPPLMTQNEWRTAFQPIFDAQPWNVEIDSPEGDSLIFPLPEGPFADVRRYAATYMTQHRYEKTESGRYKLRVDGDYLTSLIEDGAGSLPPSIGSFDGPVLLFIAGRAQIVTDAGHAALRNELGERLTSVRLDADHDIMFSGWAEMVPSLSEFLRSRP